MVSRRKPAAWVLFALLALATLTGALACGDAVLKEFTPTPTPNDDPDVTFRIGVLGAFLAEDCAPGAGGCHSYSGGAPAAGIGFGGGSPPATADDIYADIQAGGASNGIAGSDLNFVEVEQSLLLTKPLSGTPVSHGGGKQFESDEEPGYRSIKGWIESGAPNN